MIQRSSVERSATIVALMALGVISTSVSAAALGLIIAVVLTSLAIWEYEPWIGAGHPPRSPTLRTVPRPVAVASELTDPAPVPE